MNKGVKMKKFVSIALCLLMLAFAATAFASARMPENRGVVTDDANVLSAQTVTDIESYAEDLDDETDVRLHVVMVHFLDGMDVQGYADALFTLWDLSSDDLLIVGAAGEDSFAVAMGKEVRDKLGEKNASNLMFTSSDFSAKFRAQQYDAAFASYFVAFNTLVEKQYDETIKLGSRFQSAQASAAAPQATANPSGYGSQLWSDIMDSIRNRDDSYQSYQQTHKNEDNGIGVGGWVVLAIIIGIVFSQSDPARKQRRSGRDYRSYGCGCSPLGWIFSIFGVNVLLNNLRHRR